MFSIISVYNNKKTLNDYLLKSLKKQNTNYELILVDNSGGRFKSMAKALNFAAKKTKKQSKYIMFVHQDIDFCSGDWLEKAEKILDSILNLGIAGIAGMSNKGENNKERGRNIIEHGKSKELWSWGNIIKKPEEVQTLDECLFIIPRSVFNKLKFDEETCDNWHLYGVDYCLSIKNYNLGAYAIPMFVYHESSGYSMSPEYYITLKKIIKKHKKKYQSIYTTTGDWNTFLPLALQRLIKK